MHEFTCNFSKSSRDENPQIPARVLRLQHLKFWGIWPLCTSNFNMLRAPLVQGLRVTATLEGGPCGQVYRV
jgi:hypothetical protein